MLMTRTSGRENTEVRLRGGRKTAITLDRSRPIIAHSSALLRTPPVPANSEVDVTEAAAITVAPSCLDIWN